MTITLANAAAHNHPNHTNTHRGLHAHIHAVLCTQQTHLALSRLSCAPGVSVSP
jgi:hypothetical protein